MKYSCRPLIHLSCISFVIMLPCSLYVYISMFLQPLLFVYSTYMMFPIFGNSSPVYLCVCVCMYDLGLYVCTCFIQSRKPIFCIVLNVINYVSVIKLIIS
jgi:hypothetical protein